MKTPWRYIQDDAVLPHIGLATDEVLMHAHREPQTLSGGTVRLYTYRSHCALVGRFQNLEAEVNLEACRALKIPVGRRMTGGGAIIMGEAQLGICVTRPAKELPQNMNQRQLYAYFARPIINALHQMGIEAQFRPKNDLEVNGRKIAGLGIYTDAQGAVLFHCSLLVDLDIDLMLKILQIPREKISDKVLVRSIRQRMTTIRREQQSTISLESVRQQVKAAMAEYFNCQLVPYQLSASEQTAVAQLAQRKYHHPEWIYQYHVHQDANGAAIKKTTAGLLRVYVALFGNTIKSVMITGDFLEMPAVFPALESALKWHPLNKQDLLQNVNAIWQKHATPEGLDAQLVASLIWEAARRAQWESRFTYNGTCYYPRNRQTVQSQLS